MNSFLNIQVKVIVAQARQAVAQLQSQIKGLNFSGATSGSNGFFGSMGRIDRIGSQMQWLGRQIEYNFTLPIVAAGTAATKFALDNEKALTRIQKVYGDGSQSASEMTNEINALSKAFVALSDQFGISQADTLNIAADWAAAGASGVALAKSVQLTMSTMVLGEMDAGTATQSLIAIQSQYGQSISELADTIDILNMVENQTGISMQGLIAGFSRTAGVARASGVGVRELAADLAALTPATGSAANAGNALKTIFSRLLSPTKQTSEVLGLMGINTKEMAWQSANAQNKLLMMAGSFEKLSDAQKGLVSSIIASRYQVNRFEVLMDELTSKTGYYQKALQSTADMSKVYAQAQKELNQVLTSNPQRLKIIWTTLQNAMADIIQPLIPLVLYLAQTVQQLVQAFSNLNPAVQKLILFGLALLAAIGPIVRYLGAIQVLIFEMAKLFKLFLIPIGLVTGAFKYLIALPVGIFFKGIALIMSNVLIPAAINTAAIIPRIFAAMWVVMGPVFRAGAIVISDLWRLWLLSLGNIMAFGGRVIVGTWNVIWFLIEEGTLAGWNLITRIWVIMTSGLERVLIAFAAFSGRTWRAIMMAPVLLATGLLSGLRNLFLGFVPMLRNVGAALIGALISPWGLVIAGIIALILIFWKQIRQVFSNGINWIRANASALGNAFNPIARAADAAANVVLRAFHALPAGIQSAMIAVVDTIAAAAKAVYQWFSYLNPWARHSPSLVENVTSGVAAIKAQYDSLTGIGSVFAKSAGDLATFADAVKQVNQAADNAHYDEIRKELQAMAADAIPAFNQLLSDLGPLQSQLAAVESAMNAQQNVVSALKDQLDAANNSLQAQKDALDAIKNSVNDFTSQVNAINGGLEVLNGTREMLRQAGAGSDILSGYDAQINALKDQKKGINDQLNAAQKAYTDQRKLVDDLTASRDRLQASYDQENQKLQIISDSYGKIKDQISAITDAINNFDQAAKSVTAAAGGKVSDIAANFAAGAGANFPDVGGGGILGREQAGISDQSSLIDAFTKDIQDKTKNLFGMFNFMDPIKKGWNAAWGWVKSTFGPIGKEIGGFFAHLFDGVGNPFSSIDFSGYIGAIKGFFTSIGDFFTALWRLIGPPLTEIGRIIVDEFGKAWKEISPEIAKFKDLIGPVGQLFKELWTVIKPLAAILGGALLLAFSIIASVLKEVLRPALDIIITIIKDVIRVLRGVIEFLVGVFTGNWKLAWQGIVDIFGGIFDAIINVLKDAGLIVWGVIKGIVEGVVNFFKWLYDELVGHSIIPDLVNAVIVWFTLLKDVAVAIWNALVAAIKWIWDNILKPTFDAIGIGIRAVGDVISAMVNFARQRWDDFIAGIKLLWSVVQQIVGWIRDKFNEIVAAISSVVNQVRAWIDNFVGALGAIRNRIAGAFSGIFDGLKDAFKNAVNWIIGKWNGLSFGVGPFKVETPNLPFLARGGLVADQAMAIVGEGRKGYPEYVIPTDPQYRDRALSLFESLGGDLGMSHILGGATVLNTLASQLTRGTSNDRIKFYASGGIWGSGTVSASSRGGSMVLVAAPQAHTEYHFHGDLSFPNIKGGNDAKEFIKNLQALTGS